MINKKIMIMMLSTLLLGGGYAVAGEVRTLERGSPERAAMLELIRPPIEHLFGGKVRFRVEHLRIVDSIALVIVTPLKPNGEPYPARSEYDDGSRTEAILQKKKGAWKLVEYGSGATDVWYADYCYKNKNLCWDEE